MNCQCWTNRTQTQAHRAVPAALGRRLEASLNTAAFIIFFAAICNLITLFLALDVLFEKAGFGKGLTAIIINAIHVGVPIGAILLDAALNRTTYGMRKRQLEFIQPDGSQAGHLRAACRVFIGLVFLPLSPVSWIFAALDERRRTVADLTCGTVVVLTSATSGKRMCSGCGYNLTGNTSGVCPECGQQA